MLRTLFLALALPGAAAAAQSSTTVPVADTPARYAFSLLGGATQFDLSGTGTTPSGSARVETTLRRWLLAEGALTVFRADLQSGRRQWYGVPEVQLQVQLPAGSVRPYLGAGVGALIGGRRNLAVSGAVGVRGDVTQQAGLRAELRVRGIGRSFGGATADYLVGVSWRF